MKYLILLFTSFLVTTSEGQRKDPLPKFGVIDRSELLKSDCDYDKEAPVEILLETEEVECMLDNTSNYLRISYRKRIKILNEKGLSAGVIRIPYFRDSREDEIRNIKAISFHLDPSGKIITSKLDAKAIVSRQINKRQAELLLNFPDVQIGSVLEFAYTEESTLESGFRDWYFQNTVPVRFSRYTIHFPQQIPISCEPHCMLPYSREIDKESTNTTYSFSMSNIPSFREEPFMSGWRDYLERLEIKQINVNSLNAGRESVLSWSNIVYRLLASPDFGMQCNLTLPIPPNLEDSLRIHPEPFNKMLAIFNYLRKNMEWNGQTSLETMEGVRIAWKEKKGSDGEVNLILLNLLRNAGLDARPILLSTHDHGIINTLHPGFEPFNKVMVDVNLGDRSYVLDATDKYTPPGLIPWYVMLSEGILLVDIPNGKWEWKFLWDERQAFKQSIFINAIIDEKGLLFGSARVYSYDYCRVARYRDLKNGRDGFEHKYFSGDSNALKVSRVTIENEDNDTLPLIQGVEFSQRLPSSGKFSYLKTNLFSGLDTNPFTEDKRLTDIFFGADQLYNIVYNLKIPPGYSLNKIPASLKMRMPDNSCLFTRLVDTTDGNLAIQVTVDFHKPMYRISSYPNFKEFYQKLIALLQEETVLIKKDEQVN